MLGYFNDSAGNQHRRFVLELFAAALLHVFSDLRAGYLANALTYVAAPGRALINLHAKQAADYPGPILRVHCQLSKPSFTLGWGCQRLYSAPGMPPAANFTKYPF